MNNNVNVHHSIGAIFCNLKWLFIICEQIRIITRSYNKMFYGSMRLGLADLLQKFYNRNSINQSLNIAIMSVWSNDEATRHDI